MGSGCSSGAGGDGRYPGVSGESVLDGGEHVNSVLAGGGCVSADGVAVPGGGFRAEPAADLLLGFRGAQVAFSLVAGGRDGGVGEEPQHAGDLGWPDRLRVGLRSVLDVPEQVGCAQLVADAAEVVVVLVPVVDDDGAVQVAVDEALERGQGPLAEEVIGRL